METLDRLDTGNQERLLEKGSDLVFYAFDEYGRLEHYARITASIPEAHAHGHRCVSLTLHWGGDDMRRFVERDMGVFGGLPDAVERLREEWPNRPIWWERDGSIPGVEDGITLDELRGSELLARLRRDTERNMRICGIAGEDAQSEADQRTLESVGLRISQPTLFDMFEEYVIAGIERLRDAGEPDEAVRAWERQSYRLLLRSVSPRHASEETGSKG